MASPGGKLLSEARLMRNGEHPNPPMHRRKTHEIWTSYVFFECVCHCTCRRSSSPPVCALGYLPPGRRYFLRPVSLSNSNLPPGKQRRQLQNGAAAFFCHSSKITWAPWNSTWRGRISHLRSVFILFSSFSASWGSRVRQSNVGPAPLRQKAAPVVRASA